jgi:hypothetical protein
MARLEDMARAALEGDALKLRSLVQDWLQTAPRLVDAVCPATGDAAVLAVSASLAELLAERTGQAAPTWTRGIGALPQAVFLVRAAATMPRLRRMCEAESPLPLKRRNLFAPADYLRFA